MKKNIFFALFSAMLLMTACQQHEIDRPADLGDGFTLVGHSDAQTKTAFGTPDGNTIPFLWSEGDIIFVNGVESNPLSIGGASAEFTFSDGSVTEGDDVYYGQLIDDEVWVLPFQEGDPAELLDDFGHAKVGEDNTFTLQHYTSYLWLNPYSTEVTGEGKKVSSVTIKAANNIVGKSKFDATNKSFGEISSAIVDPEAPELAQTKELLLEFWGDGGAEPRALPTASSNVDIWAVAVVFPVTTGEIEVIYNFEDGSMASYTHSTKTLEAGQTYRISQEIKAEDLYTLKTLTFEDDDVKFTRYELEYCSAEINTWSDLIDETQYSGDILYSMSQTEEHHYSWTDENNTFLAHHLPYNYGMYWYAGGGHAISNYATGDYVTYGNYQYQLTIYKPNAGNEVVSGGGGHNGSDNFCVHFGYMDGSLYNQTDELPSIYFGDGKPRVIDHMWVANTVYALNCFGNGNSLTAAIQEGDKVYVTATGYDKNDTQVGQCTIYLVNGPDNIVDGWVKWDLSSLGEVSRVDFNVLGTSDNGYGFSQPAYFAYDDVAVRFPIE